MKKIFLIIVLIFSFQNNLLAQDFGKFNQWLLENGHTQYLKEGGKVDICKTFKKNSARWLNEECGNYPEGKMRLMNNLKIETYGGRWAIPSKKDPKRATQNLVSIQKKEYKMLFWEAIKVETYIKKN